MLSEFIIYGEHKNVLVNKYFYDSKNKLIKTSSFKRWEPGIDKVVKEEIYFLNSCHNINSTYEYTIRNDKRELSDIRIYKYDKKLNPYKNLLYIPISENYFNSNNVITCQYLEPKNHKVRFTIKKNYKYDNEDRLIREFNDKSFESDSIVQIYHYNN